MVWRAYLDYRSNTFSSKNCTISSRQGGDFIGFEAHMPPFSTCICGKKLPSSMASRANCKKKLRHYPSCFSNHSEIRQEACTSKCEFTTSVARNQIAVAKVDRTCVENVGSIVRCSLHCLGGGERRLQLCCEKMNIDVPAFTTRGRRDQVQVAQVRTSKKN